MLTKKERKILSGEIEVKDSYLRSVRLRAKRKAQKALEDLTFLARTQGLPERTKEKIFAPDKLADLIDAVLTCELKLQKTKRLPPSMGRKRPKYGGCFIKVAGVRRRPNGAPEIRTDLQRFLSTSRRILATIHKKLSDKCHLESADEVVEFKQSPNGELIVAVSTLKGWLKNAEKPETTKILVIEE